MTDRLRHLLRTVRPMKCPGVNEESRVPLLGLCVSGSSKVVRPICSFTPPGVRVLARDCHFGKVALLVRTLDALLLPLTAALLLGNHRVTPTELNSILIGQGSPSFGPPALFRSLGHPPGPPRKVTPPRTSTSTVHTLPADDRGRLLTAAAIPEALVDQQQKQLHPLEYQNLHCEVPQQARRESSGLFCHTEPRSLHRDEKLYAS